MICEESIIRAFLEGPLTRVEAIARLVGLEMSSEDAERLLDEATDSFTSSDQIARDMRMGVFPRMSDRTKSELSERARISAVVIEELQLGYKSTNPSLAQMTIWKLIAHSIAMRLVPTATDALPGTVQP